MGYGDEIMATAFAKIEKQKYPEREVVVGDFKSRKANYSKVFYNNPNISDPRKLDKNKIIHFVNHCNINRPYVNYKKTTDKTYVWNMNHRAIPGELYFDKQEINKAQNVIQEAIAFWKTLNSTEYKGVIFIETSRSIKMKHTLGLINNRNLSFEKWEKIINILRKSYLIIQPTHSNSSIHNNIFSYDCDFRTACAIMKYCNLFLGPEGGFPHAAAALGKPAVVIFGGWISPQVTGYDFHENIYIDINGSPCGIRDTECDHCKECMSLIKTERIIKAVEKNIYKKIRHNT